MKEIDMKKSELFSKSVVIAYIIMSIFYLPVAIGAFIVFSDSKIDDNIIVNLNTYLYYKF
jgi:hypothetical protein